MSEIVANNTSMTVGGHLGTCNPQPTIHDPSPSSLQMHSATVTLQSENIIGQYPLPDTISQAMNVANDQYSFVQDGSGPYNAIKFGLWNIQCLNQCKLLDPSFVGFISDCDIFMLCETWTDSKSIIGIPNFMAEQSHRIKNKRHVESFQPNRRQIF